MFHFYGTGQEKNAIINTEKYRHITKNVLMLCQFSIFWAYSIQGGAYEKRRF